MAMTSGPGNPLLDDPVAFLFTDGSALPNGTSGWGVHITYPDWTETRGLWGPVVTSARVPNWVSAFAATSNTGELSGMYHALDWIDTRRPPVVRPRYSIVPDSDYCVKLFATRSIKPIANKRMITRIYALLVRVKQTNDVSISWTPSHTKEDSPLARGNAAADLLAARGCVVPCLSRSACTGLPSPARRPRSSTPRPPRRSSASALLRRTRGVRGLCGRTSLFALPRKCLTWRVSLQAPEGTTNVFCINDVGRSGVTPARGPRQRMTGNSFSAALFAHRMPPQQTTHTITSFGPANTPC